MMLLKIGLFKITHPTAKNIQSKLRKYCMANIQHNFTSNQNLRQNQADDFSHKWRPNGATYSTMNKASHNEMANNMFL